MKNVTFDHTKLIEARERAGLRQAEAARRAGLSPQELSRYETGDAVPGGIRLVRLCQVYDLADIRDLVPAAA